MSADLTAKLTAALDETERTAKAAASLCGCCPMAPEWTFADDENGGRIVIEGERHPGVRRQLTRRWNRTHHDLFTARHIVRHNPDSVLRQVAAHRELITEYEQAHAYYDAHKSAPAGEVHGLYTAIKLIAKGYGIETDDE